MKPLVIHDPVAVMNPHPVGEPIEGVVFGCAVEEIIEVGPGDSYVDITVSSETPKEDLVLRLDKRAVNMDLLVPGNFYVFGKGMVDVSKSDWSVLAALSRGHVQALVWMGPQ